MKSKIITHAGITIICAVAAAAITVPTDQACISGSSGILASLPLSSFLEREVFNQVYQVHNYLIFKTVTNRITGEVVGYGALTIVISA